MIARSCVELKTKLMGINPITQVMFYNQRIRFRWFTSVVIRFPCLNMCFIQIEYLDSIIVVFDLEEVREKHSKLMDWDE